MRFSICIPTYEMHGHGGACLERLLDSIYRQTCKDVEVVVSDHSRIDDIETICRQWSQRLHINYLKYAEKRGNSSANMNHAIGAATGEIVKIMHQDDFFYRPSCLDEIDMRCRENPEYAWGACAFIHYNGEKYYRPITPYYQSDIIRAVNTIGAPSVLFFYRDKTLFFDEHLIWMNDCELYYRLCKAYGAPLIAKNTGVAIGQWPQQVTHTLATKALQQREKKYALKKHRLHSRHSRVLEKIFNISQYAWRLLASRFVKTVVSPVLSKIYHENSLTTLANRYGVDKGTRKFFAYEGARHHYTNVYQAYFQPIRLHRLNILEIGIGSGASLNMWLKYFPHAHVYAIDIDDFSHLNNSRLTCLRADQSNRQQLAASINAIGEGLDIIIDDGGHYMRQQQISFGFLFKYLNPGGLYFIEDLHTSYWPHNGFVAVYNDIPIDTNADKSNTTLKMIQEYISQGQILSPYLLGGEIRYANENIGKCILYDTVKNAYGPNHIAVFVKK